MYASDAGLCSGEVDVHAVVLFANSCHLVKKLCTLLLMVTMFLVNGSLWEKMKLLYIVTFLFVYFATCHFAFFKQKSRYSVVFDVL